MEPSFTCTACPWNQLLPCWCASCSYLIMHHLIDMNGACLFSCILQMFWMPWAQLSTTGFLWIVGIICMYITCTVKQWHIFQLNRSSSCLPLEYLMVFVVITCISFSSAVRCVLVMVCVTVSAWYLRKFWVVFSGKNPCMLGRNINSGTGSRSFMHCGKLKKLYNGHEAVSAVSLVECCLVICAVCVVSMFLCWCWACSQTVIVVVVLFLANISHLIKSTIKLHFLFLTLY